MYVDEEWRGGEEVSVTRMHMRKKEIERVWNGERGSENAWQSSKKGVRWRRTNRLYGGASRHFIFMAVVLSVSSRLYIGLYIIIPSYIKKVVFVSSSSDCPTTFFEKRTGGRLGVVSR